MTSDKLTVMVEQSGLKKSFIADKLGITYQGYLNKEKGKSDFTSKEIGIMRDLLHLTNKEVMEIFLS
jgi:DNA-binding XRE family transcriptional regulator